MLWIAIFLLVLLLFLIRRSFGIVSVPAAIAALAVVTRYVHAGLEEVIIYGMTWLLLLSGVRVAATTVSMPGTRPASALEPGDRTVAGKRRKSANTDI